MNYTFRMHDPRVGRFFAMDPLAPKYPFYSPYQFSGNRTMDMVELEGLEPAEPAAIEGVRKNAIDQTAVANNDYHFSDFFGWLFGITSNNKLYKTWVSHTGTANTAAGWYEETNYKQMVMPYAVDYAQSQGWSYGKDWQTAKDLISNPNEPNFLISKETYDFIGSRSMSGDYFDYLTQIGANEINSANKDLASKATGAITPMELDSPFFVLGLGLRGFAMGTVAEDISITASEGLNTRFISTSEGTIIDLEPTLNRISSGGKFPHKNDGSIFMNRPPKGTNNPLLPIKPEGYYNEFVVPTPGINGPGAMRIVTGQGGEMWFTLDHYKSFIPIR